MKELNYKIKDFEGPLDLLLHLLAKHRMQLFDIRIYELIDQYLAFVGEVGPDELEPTSEFIEMAARLVYMKSAALLPRTEEAEQLERELTGQLVEYGLCKEAAAKLRDMSEGINFFVRRPLELQLPTDYTRRHAARELLEAYRISSGRAKPLPGISAFEPIVTAPVVSVESRVVHILSSLAKRGGVHINHFFRRAASRSETVATFLGLLELIRDGRICVEDDGTVCAKHTEKEKTGA